MKEIYESPEIEIIEFDTEDVITTSDNRYEFVPAEVDFE